MAEERELPTQSTSELTTVEVPCVHPGTATIASLLDIHKRTFKDGCLSNLQFGRGHQKLADHIEIPIPLLEGNHFYRRSILGIELTGTIPYSDDTEGTIDYYMDGASFHMFENMITSIPVSPTCSVEVEKQVDGGCAFMAQLNAYYYTNDTNNSIPIRQRHPIILSPNARDWQRRVYEHFADIYDITAIKCEWSNFPGWDDVHTQFWDNRRQLYTAAAVEGKEAAVEVAISLLAKTVGAEAHIKKLLQANTETKESAINEVAAFSTWSGQESARLGFNQVELAIFNRGEKIEVEFRKDSKTA